MKQQKEIVEKVVNYIEDNIKREISVDIIAKNVGYSKFYLNRIFSERTGITIYKYLQSRRLTIAAEKLIKQTSLLQKLLMKPDMTLSRHFHLLLSSYMYTRPKFIEIWRFLCQSKTESPCMEISIIHKILDLSAGLKKRNWPHEYNSLCH